ncbi:MAG: hypothetical protein IH874_03875 [Candidatus Dadabacteria bacterium]|nr:hypothetical protein [Candidatus Dadabacteria bacterium]
MARFAKTANARVATAFWTYTAVGSTEAAGRPATNISELGRPSKSWRSTTTGEQSVVLDFSTARSVPSVFLDNCNFATVKIQGNAADVWTSPSFDSGNLTLNNDPKLGRRKRLIDLTAFNLRFMRILISSQTVDDNASFYEIGDVASVQTIATLTENIEYPLRWVGRVPKIRNDFISGGFETVEISSARPLNIQFAVRQSNDSANVQEIYDLFGNKNRKIILDLSLVQDWESYLCEVESDINNSWVNSGLFDFNEIEAAVFV